MTDFIDKQTVIEASWLNAVDATVVDALQSATTALAARGALDVPQETPEAAPQVRVNGAWVALSASTPALHAASHISGGSDELDHDALVNGAGDKHVPHTGVSVTAGSGLTGGGDISVSRTIAFSYVLEQELNAGGYRISNLLDPTGGAANDVCTKGYADNLVIEAGANPWQGGVPADSIYYSTGFVGIGTDTPVTDLDVRGTSQFIGDVALGADVDVTGNMSLFSGNLDVAGTLGVGTNNPAETLHVVGTIRSSGNNYGSLTHDPSAISGGFGIDFTNTGDTLQTLRLFRLTNTTATAKVDIYRGDNSSSLQHRLSSYGNSFINALTGDLGIGISSPTEKLHVAGNILVTGTVIGPDTAWKTEISGIQYRKLATGLVIVELTANLASLASIATNLPVGYRPQYDSGHAVASTTVGSAAVIEINSSGTISNGSATHAISSSASFIFAPIGL